MSTATGRTCGVLQCVVSFWCLASLYVCLANSSASCRAQLKPPLFPEPSAGCAFSWSVTWVLDTI